jgi:hypothetical protein
MCWIPKYFKKCYCWYRMVVQYLYIFRLFVVVYFFFGGVKGLVGQKWPSLDIISTALNCSHDTNNTSWNIWESSTLLIECLSVSSLLVCQSTLCLHLPQCSELTCCCLIILCYAKLFIKKNLLLTMYYKENFMWNSMIVTIDGLQYII